MRNYIHALLVFSLLGWGVSCSTMSVDEEFADFDPIMAPQGSSGQEAKALKMFADYNPDKKSEFSGKEFKGKEAFLRSSYEKKEYVDHPYYKLRKKGYFSDKKAFQTKSAREGTQVASWQNNENSWFKRVFSKKESGDGSKEFIGKSYRLPEAPRTMDNRSSFEQKNYPIKIIDEPNRDKKITKQDLRDLLNSR